MDFIDTPATDSGYPTPRDDIPLSSSESPPPTPSSSFPLTSTPLRNRNEQQRKSLKDHFEQFKEESLLEERTIENSHNSTPNRSKSLLIEAMKPVLKMVREVKQLKRENETLLNESQRVFCENEAYKQILSDQSSAPVIPKLMFPDFENMKLKDEIKKEISSFIKIEGDRTILEERLKQIISNDSMMKPHVMTATANIQVNCEKLDADVQTDGDNVNQLNTSLKIEVDQLSSKLECSKKETLDLQNRLFSYEKLKETFETNEKVLKESLEQLQQKKEKTEKRIGDLEVRLSTIRTENDEIRAENRKLIEESKVHDFEVDEIKIELGSLKKQKEDLENQLENIKSDLQTMTEMKEQLIREKEEILKKHEEEKNELQNKLEILLANGEAQNERSAQIIEEAEKKLEEARKIEKDNQYLTAAQETLIESEMRLKRRIIELENGQKNMENHTFSIEEQLEKEKMMKNQLENENDDLKMKIQELEDNKQETDELLEEMAKGKKEIDFLRKECQRLSSGTDEVVFLKKELEAKNQEIQKLSQNLENINLQGKEEKIEELIREAASKEKEVENLKLEIENKQRIMTEIVEDAKVNIKIYEELKNFNDALIAEYKEFKKKSTEQYYCDIMARDVHIKSLEDRLVQLETYPGQNISIAKRNMETQTPVELLENEEIQPRSRSSVGSFMSTASHQSTIETKIEKMIKKLREYTIMDVCSTSSFTSQSSLDICHHVVELVESLLNEMSAPVAGASRFWESLTKKMRQVESEWKNVIEKMESEKKRVEEEIEKIRHTLSSLTEKMKDEISAHTEVLKLNRCYEEEREILNKKVGHLEMEAAKNEQLAVGFKEEYEFQLQEKKELVENLKRMTEAQEEERKEWENEAKQLRERLQASEHEIQRRMRERMSADDDRESEIDKLRRELERAIDKMAESEAEKLKYIQKVKFNKETINEFKEANRKLEEKTTYLKKRNTERQKLLDYAMKAFQRLEVEQGDENRLRRSIHNTREDLMNRSQFITEHDLEAPSETSGSNIFEKNRRGTERRILSNRNVELTQ